MATDSGALTAVYPAPERLNRGVFVAGLIYAPILNLRDRSLGERIGSVIADAE